MTADASPSGRPVRTVLDPLRVRIDHDRFGAAVLELATVAADLGYGDVRALSGSLRGSTTCATRQADRARRRRRAR